MKQLFANKLKIFACLILGLGLLGWLCPKNISLAYAATLTLSYPEGNFTLSEPDLAALKGFSSWSETNFLIRPQPNLNQLLAANYGQNFLTGQPVQNQTYDFQIAKIYQLLKTAGGEINATTTEPVLDIVNNRATNFVPPQNGRAVDVYASTFNVLKALQSGFAEADLVVRETSPNASLAQTNQLGINDLIAEGVSSFAGSPKNRKHNIQVGVDKFKGVIIPPGQEFSFNQNLGPVEAAEGFLPELVIKKNDTVPELGGGLCQVSTTTFRAAMAAGLPITQRKNHAYAVQYYAPQGTDATIYPGVIDLKFINNTPGAILIWPYIKSPNTLVFDFYGSKDGRQVTLEKPQAYDRQSDGSMKATWTRDIFNNGTTTSDTFKSVYQSPALFHKTEEFVKATITPASGLTAPPAKTQ